MSVHIRFEPQNESGLVAEGSNLWDAARRLGVPIPADCKGLGECDSCVVVVQNGANLLSAPTPAEHNQLGFERLQSDRRLACQTRVERTGDLVLMLEPATENAKTVEETADEFRKEFRELPLGSKIRKLAEFEAVSAFEALTTIASLPFRVGEKVLDVIANYERKRRGTADTRVPDANSPGDDEKEKRVEEPPN